MNINKLFIDALKFYNQTTEKFYISSENLHGLNLAVLPLNDTWIFPTYNFGDDDDVLDIWNLWNKNNIFKTFNCSLCPISRKDDIVLFSIVQNNYPLVRQYSEFNIENWSISNRNYKISVTEKQYYYSHLLFSSENHIPNYAIFINKLLFTDIFNFLRSANDDNLIGIFNGATRNSHFHLELTNQNLMPIESIINNVLNSMVDEDIFSYTIPNSFIHCLVIHGEDIDKMFDSIQNIVINEYLSKSVEFKERYSLTANFLIRNNKNIVILHIIDNNTLVQNILNCNYSLIPAGYVLIANCFNIPKTDYEKFKQEIYIRYANTYKQFNVQNIPQDYLKLELDVNLIQNDIEQIYYAINNLSIDSKKSLIQLINNLLINFPNCFDYACSDYDNAKFKYLVGVLVVLFTEKQLQKWLNKPTVYASRIHSIFNNLNRYNKNGFVNTDALYFKGNFLTGLLKKTFNNLLLITDFRKITLVPELIDNNDYLIETFKINDWMNYIFNNIGSGASGIITTTNLRGPFDIDFVMKIMKIQTVEKMKAFRHEFLSSIQINSLRTIIPNFIICYGGFSCSSSDIKNLCNLSQNSDRSNLYSYILLENVKNSNTFGNLIRHKIPIDIFNIIYQVLASLSIAWEYNHFTHYDLHIYNIMIYDFLKTGENAIFKYYFDQNTFITIPVEHLCLIIDYGYCYIDSMPKDGVYTSKRYAERFGMTANKPNKIYDVYIFIMSLLQQLFVFQPKIILSDEKLVTFLLKFFKEYGELYITDYYSVMKYIRNECSRHKKETQKYRDFDDLFNMLIKPEYRTPNCKYLSPKFNENFVDADFRGAKNVLAWLYSNIYNYHNLNSTNIYNWGYVPNNVSLGKEIILFDNISQIQKVKDLMS